MADKSLYQRMKDRGISMSWYEKARAKSRQTGAIPLDNDTCSLGSIYFLNAKGELWTVDHGGDAYNKVRDAKRKPSKPTLVCLHCGEQWDNMPAAHPITTEGE